MSIEKNVYDLSLWAVLAAAGGVAKFLAMMLDEHAPQMTKKRILFLLGANVFVSGFSGLMGALMMSIVTPDSNWHFVSAGIFGFLGAKGLEILSEKVSKKI